MEKFETDGLFDVLIMKIRNNRYKVYAVYANGELANLYNEQEVAEMAVDDLLELGVDAEMEIMGVII